MIRRQHRCAVIVEAGNAVMEVERDGLRLVLRKRVGEAPPTALVLNGPAEVDALVDALLAAIEERPAAVDYHGDEIQQRFKLETPWTRREDKTAQLRFSLGEPLHSIAEALGRDEASVRNRLAELAARS